MECLHLRDHAPFEKPHQRLELFHFLRIPYCLLVADSTMIDFRKMPNLTHVKTQRCGSVTQIYTFFLQFRLHG